MEKDYDERYAFYRDLACIVLTATAVIVALTLMTSCKAPYVPVETVHEYVHHHTDTVHRTDTVTNTKETIIREASEADSALLAQYGIRLKDNERLLLFLQKELDKEKSKEVEHHTDTVIKVESIQVPYPVEKKLPFWEKAKLASIGFSASVILIAASGFIIWIRKHYRRK